MTDRLDDLLKRRLAQLPAVPADEAFVVAVRQRVVAHRRRLQAVYGCIAVLSLAALWLVSPWLLRLATTVSSAPLQAQPMLQWAFTSIPLGLVAAAAVILWAWRRA